MNDLRERQSTLEEMLHREVPLSATIGMAVHFYDGRQIEMHADLEPNINVHGVAFGGSIYSTCALAGWGLLVLRLEDRGLDPRIMIAGAEIEYFKPINQTIRASCTLGDQELENFIASYAGKNKARITLPVETKLDDGTTAAEFIGHYAAFARTS